ncbi:beta-1,3-1,4-glucanase [Delitschia confertaspora ATCC 74209]|uniref:Beta-1,3-1,4-glucanase n=1 Tax=Delitschia confertaspora ATCC 74209 TaxID=1513339 RepID=A0A9P4JK16_9PLEO|nr:beta-1,3-1,4-glucanase [Delitschia confertaspora ATCC 74209]
MPSTPFLTLALATTLFLNPAVATYKIVDDYTSNTSDFFSLFNFFTEPDPTQGFVSYQPYSSAVASKLIGRMPDNSIYIGVDYTTKLSVAFNSPGRASIRIEGKKSYNWGLMIADIWHMPDSTCGNWPAMWLLGSGPWPHGGEVDILEGVNDAVRNVVTLHTGEGCVVDRMEGGGTASESNSTSYMTRKSGCGGTAPKGSFGDEFNKKKGGIWALQVESDAIKIWYFARNSTPRDLSGGKPDPDKWGKPDMDFRAGGCDIGKAFKKLSIMFNITFCGENAGKTAWSTWTGCQQSTKKTTCEEFVGATPHAFDQAYFLINNIKLFQK